MSTKRMSVFSPNQTLETGDIPLLPAHPLMEWDAFRLEGEDILRRSVQRLLRDCKEHEPRHFGALRVFFAAEYDRHTTPHLVICGGAGNERANDRVVGCRHHLSWVLWRPASECSAISGGTFVEDDEYACTWECFCVFSPEEPARARAWCKCMRRADLEKRKLLGQLFRIVRDPHIAQVIAPEYHRGMRRFSKMRCLSDPVRSWAASFDFPLTEKKLEELYRHAKFSPAQLEIVQCMYDRARQGLPFDQFEFPQALYAEFWLEAEKKRPSWYLRHYESDDPFSGFQPLLRVQEQEGAPLAQNLLMTFARKVRRAAAALEKQPSSFWSRLQRHGEPITL